MNKDESTVLTDEQKFLSNLKFIKKAYILTLVITAALTLGAIISAVHFRASFGLVMGVLAVVTYLAIVINLLYSKLGIAYRSFQGKLTITELYGKNREVIYIPDRLIFQTVTEIGANAFSHESSKDIREIHLPKTLLHIGENAFANLPELTDLYFEGAEDEWNKISALSPLQNVNIHFYTPIPKLEKPKKAKKAKKDKKYKKDKKDKKDKNSDIQE